MNVTNHRQRFLAELCEYLGTDYLIDRGKEITEDTLWSELSIDLLDKVMLENLLGQIYGLAEHRAVLHAAWPVTVGEMLDRFEQGLTSMQALPTKFCDSNRIIFCSYPGGAGGFALRWILLQSPDTTGADGFDDGISEVGAAHNMCSRFGLRWNDENGKPDDNYLSMHTIANAISKDFNLLTFFLPFVPPGLITSCRDRFDWATNWQNDPVSNWQSWGKCIMSDHIPPKAARHIFPNAKLLLLYMPFKERLRNFWRKLILQPENPGDPVSFLHSLMERLDSTELDMLWGQYFYAKTLDTMYTSPDLSAGAYVIDALRLFSPTEWRDEYDRLIDHCDLQPNYAAVESFVHEYASKQFKRGVSQT